MAYTSPIPPGCPIITDLTPPSFLAPPKGFSRGLIPRDYKTDPAFGSTHEVEFPRSMYIPRSEWKERIEYRERTKSRNIDIIRQANLICKDQNGTNYCWINAPVYAVEVIRLAMGLPTVRLSPASVGAKIKNFRNVGGWGTQGMRFMVEHGVVPTSLWPDNAINRQHDKPDSWAEAKNYVPSEWYWSPPRDYDAKISMLLWGFPVPCGYNWWGHEITALDAVILPNGRIGSLEMNSWRHTWGDWGTCVLDERKTIADDQFCPRVMHSHNSEGHRHASHHYDVAAGNVLRGREHFVDCGASAGGEGGHAGPVCRADDHRRCTGQPAAHDHLAALAAGGRFNHLGTVRRVRRGVCVVS